jgi:hypothetical protein
VPSNTNCANSLANGTLRANNSETSTSREFRVRTH